MAVSKPEQTHPGLKTLWAPWRAAYVASHRNKKQSCIFCLGRLNARQRRQRLVLYQDVHAVAMLNRYPYNAGHVMVAPRSHVGSLDLLDVEQGVALTKLLSATIGILRRAFKPAGFNLGANVGRVAGAGFADHFHWHVVPRWQGDTNFMPVLASTKVISQHLEASFELLSPFFEKVHEEMVQA